MVKIENKKIIKKNKAIAKFIGSKLPHQVLFDMNPKCIWVPYFGICRHDTIELGRGKILQFHKSWDWIMVAVHQIERLGYTVCIYKCECNILMGKIVASYKGRSKLTAVYQAVHQFIKWYNKKQKK